MALNTAGIVCALASEARHLGPAVRHPGPAGRKSEPLGALADGGLVAITGMGRSAASTGARLLIDAGAEALASFGLAGGLDPVLAAGDILVPTEVVTTEGTLFQTAADWRARFSSAVVVRAGRLVTAPRAISSIADKAELFRTSGAAAVDMESAAVAEVAQQHGLPFIAVRVIVDRADDVLPHAVTAAADAEGHLQIGRLIGALALAPTELAPLMRLARRYRAANRSLAMVARTGALRHPVLPRTSHPSLS